VLTAADNTLSVLDARSGALLRTLRLDASSPSFSRGGTVGSGGPTGSRILVPTFGSVALAVLGRHIFVGSGRAVTVLDATSGKVLQTIALGEEVRHLAADPGTGQVFIAGDTTVSMLDARHHYAVRSILSGDHPSALAVDTRRGRVLVADIGATDGDGIPRGNGSVALLDAATGAVLRTVGVGVAPGALAVDERSGHVLVVDDGGPVHVQGPWDWLPQWLVDRIPFLGSQQGTRTVDGNASILGL
jgi:DNA-binding beta-propeller fold protein YncE